MGVECRWSGPRTMEDAIHGTINGRSRVLSRPPTRNVHNGREHVVGDKWLSGVRVRVTVGEAARTHMGGQLHPLYVSCPGGTVWNLIQGKKRGRDGKWGKVDGCTGLR